MENRYDGELVELKGIYEKTLAEINSRFEAKLEAVIGILGNFVEIYTVQKKYEKKLEILNCKLKAERVAVCDGCGCEDECDE